jgi:type 1 fimbria pilin
MLSTFKRNKTKLAIAAMAAGLGLHLASHAQAANDSGTLIINGQISASTCVLGLGDGASTSAGSKTLNLGTWTTTQAGTTDGNNISPTQTVVFGVQNANGTPCTLGANNTFWDIGINLNSSQVSSIAGGANAGTNHVLLSGGTSGVATGVGVMIKTSTGPTVTEGTTNLDLLRGGYNGNTLLSGSTSFPGVLPANRIALTARFVKLGTAAAGAGVFTATVPLTVWYR